jgi:hypothetical protein
MRFLGAERVRLVHALHLAERDAYDGAIPAPPGYDCLWSLGLSPFRYAEAIMSLRTFSAVFACLLAAAAFAEDDVKEFSGPQKGEPITPFSVRGVLGDKAGEEYDLVKAAKGQPIVLMFIHEVNRPSVGVARVVMDYASKLKKDGLHAGLVLLTADATATEDWAKRASYALPQGVPTSISTDGVEGPGAYGLNRKMTVTVLVAKEDKVTANFALVQPSVQADAPKIIAAIASAAGREPPTPEEIQKLLAPMRPARREN